MLSVFPRLSHLILIAIPRMRIITHFADENNWPLRNNRHSPWWAQKNGKVRTQVQVRMLEPILIYILIALACRIFLNVACVI